MKKFCCLMMLVSSLSAMDQSRANVSSTSNNLRYWVHASFIYWYAKEDGLNAAESAQVDGSGTTVFASSPAIFQQEFGFPHVKT